MRYCNGSRSRNNVEPDDEPEEEVDERVLRTRALFEAEALLQKLLLGGQRRYVREASEILTRYPTKLDIARMCGECPLLSASEAQRIVGRRDHLDFH